MYAIAVGVVRPIAAMPADKLLASCLAESHNKNIARQKRVRSATVRRNGGGDYAVIKKPWMIHLPYPILIMLQSPQIR